MTDTTNGLAAERTALAWSRTSLAVLGNGGLLLLRHFTDAVGPFELVLAIASAALAVLVVSFGRLRARQVRAGGALPAGPSVRVVLALGLSIAAFGLFVTVSFLSR
ncbi:MAG: DUF202 domain-containing protein [Mycobacteriaceae bacterium]